MKYIIFDLDGTLIDSMPIWKETEIVFLKKYGYPVPEDLHAIVKSLTIKQTAEYFHNNLGVKQPVEEIVEEFIASVANAYKNTIPLKPFVREYLEKELEQGSKMCILTASEREFIMPAIERLDLLKYMDFVMTCSEVGHFKYDGKVYELAMERLGGTLENTYVFEDALYAIQGAKKAGLHVYAIQDLGTEPDVDAVCESADRYVISFEELL